MFYVYRSTPTRLLLVTKHDDYSYVRDIAIKTSTEFKQVCSIVNGNGVRIATYCNGIWVK